MRVRPLLANCLPLQKLVLQRSSVVVASFAAFVWLGRRSGGRRGRGSYCRRRAGRGILLTALACAIRNDAVREQTAAEKAINAIHSDHLKHWIGGNRADGRVIGCVNHVRTDSGNI